MKIPRLAAVLLASACPLLGQQFEVYRQFVPTYGGPIDKLLVAADGNVYGLAEGGDYGKGQIFRMAPDGSGGYAVERLYSFHGATDGAEPYSLMQAADGRFYGTAYSGGEFGAGTAFSFDPSTGLVVLHAFEPGSFYTVVRPYRLTQASDGNFYGVTLYAGAFDTGMIYRLTPTGDFTDLHDFGSGPEGYSPAGHVVQLSDGFLYGTTTYVLAGLAAADGARLRPKGVPPTNPGTLYRMDLSGSLTVIHDFLPSDGVFTNDDLAEGPDGNLYGSAN